jgi:hypothetical protein
MRFLIIPSFVALLAACASVAQEPSPGICEAPRLVASDLIVGDGSRDRGFPGGVSLADVDNDGDLDLMATSGYNPNPNATRPYYNYRANVLYLNDGAGNFTHSDQAAFTADTPGAMSTMTVIWMLSSARSSGDRTCFIAIWAADGSRAKIWARQRRRRAATSLPAGPTLMATAIST